MNEKFLYALRKQQSLDPIRTRLINNIDETAAKQKEAVEVEYHDAQMIAAGLRQPLGTTARTIAEGFLRDAEAVAAEDEE